MIAPGEIVRLVESAIPGARATARDLTGGQDHYEITVVASAFQGRSLVERHRLVYEALRAPLAGPLHAVQLKTLAPEEVR